MLILHAIIENTPANLAVVSNAKLPFVVNVQPCDDLAGITSSLPHIDESVFEDADKLAFFASQHNALLVTLSENIDLVPIRLGAAYSSANSVFKLIDDQRSNFAAALKRIGGAVEITLHIEDAPLNEQSAKSATNSPNSGRDYLRARSHAKKIVRNRSELRHELQHRIAKTLESFARLGAKIDPQKSELALLVDRSKLSDFLDGVSSLEQDAIKSGFAIKAVGPWPAYSFVGEAA